MTYCSQCGAAVTGPFCAKCGAAVATEGSKSTGAYTTPTAGAGLQENVAATLTYALGFLTGILFLVLEPYNRNRLIRFHAWQSIFLFGGLAALNIAFSVLYAIFPFELYPLLGAIQSLIGLAGFCLWIYLLLKTYQGSKVVLPVVGPLAEKQA